MVASGGRVETAGLLSLDDATLVRLGGFLKARDLLCLALSTTRISAEIVDGAVTRQFQRRDAHVQAALPPGACSAPGSLCHLHEVEALEAPLCFSRVGPRVSLREGNQVAFRRGVTCHGGHRAALCGGHKMVAGRHFCEFTLEAGETAMVGVCPAGFDASNGEGAHFESWMYHPLSGLFVRGRRSFPNIGIYDELCI